MPLLEPCDAAHAINLLSCDVYTNYTIIANLALLHNSALLPNRSGMQAPRITVYSDASRPDAICTVENGRASSELAFTSAAKTQAPSVVREALEYALLLEAPDIQVVVEKPEHLMVCGLGGSIVLADRFIVMSPRDGSGPGRLKVSTPAGRPEGPRTFSRAIYDREEIISCARAEPLCEGYCEIRGVFTHEAHRGKGLAKRVVSELSRDVQASGRVPVYVVNALNGPSLSVAHAAGFIARAQFGVYRAPKPKC